MNTESDARPASQPVPPRQVEATAPLNWRKLFLSPNGRIGPLSYWRGIGCFFVAVLIADGIDQTFIGTANGEEGPLFLVLSFAAVYPAICFQTKRLHDLGRTGWLQALPMAMLALTAPLGAAGHGDFIILIVVAAGLLMGALFIWLAFFRGHPAANKYGEPNSGDRDIAPVAEVFS